MTVAATIRKAGPTPGNGLATVFPFAFKVFASTDIQVIRTVIATGVQTVLVLNDPLGYTVALNVDQNANPGGSITYNPLGVPLPATQQLTIVSVVPQAQGTHIINGGAFFANNIEDAVDKAVINTQDLAAKVASSIQFPAADSAALNAILPAAASRANAYVAFDGAGNVIASPGPTSQPVSVAMLPVVQAATLALGRAALGFSAYFDTLVAAASAAAIRLLLGFSAIAAKGDTFFGTAANTIATKSAPTNGYVRVADSSQSDGWLDVPFAARKNAIINGDFNVWQRGTSFVTIATGAYFADRWNYAKVGAMVHDISRSADVPTVAQAGRLFNFSVLVDCTTIDAAIAPGDFCLLAQHIEGFNFLPLAQRPMVLSFWVKATKTGIYCVSVRNGGSDRSYIGEYTINVADTWEKKTIAILASPSAGTWDYTTGKGIALSFMLAAGATSQTAAGAWQVGDFFATGNQVNACDNAANNFRIAGVQLEPGTVATDFEQRAFPVELALCQRYYEKSYDQAVFAGAINAAGALTTLASGPNAFFEAPFQVAKRVAPTVLIYSTGTGAVGNVRDTSGAVDRAAGSGNIGEWGFWVFNTVGVTDQNGHALQFTANAEL